MDNKSFNNIQNFSYKSMNDKNEDKSYDSMPYEIPKRKMIIPSLSIFYRQTDFNIYVTMIHRILILLILLRHHIT